MSKHKKHHKPHHVTTPHDSESEDINTEAQNEGLHAEAHDSAAHEDVEVEITEEAPLSSESVAEEAFAAHAGEGENQEKFRLDFIGSELIRQKAPKAMEVADVVVDEWIHDGQFQGLPVGHPLAQFAAAKVLRKAKDVEKKLEEKGVFMMARIGLDYAKSKLNKR